MLQFVHGLARPVNCTGQPRDEYTLFSTTHLRVISGQTNVIKLQGKYWLTVSDVLYTHISLHSIIIHTQNDNILDLKQK